MTEISYCLIGDKLGASTIPGPTTPNLSGLWLWAKAFREYGSDGDTQVIWRKEDLEEYDIIHINYTPSNMQLPSIIRDELGESDTKLIINVDLDVSYHGINWAYYEYLMKKELNMADLVFHVESIGAKYISELINKKVHVLPHPVDVSRLYDYIKIDRKPQVACIFHRYHPDTLTPSIAWRDIPINKHLYNYTSKEGKFAASQGTWDKIHQVQPSLEYIQNVSNVMLGCDLYRGYTFGRSIVELAALGIPTLCSNTIEASNVLFPKTSVDPMDVSTAKQTAKKLYNDHEFAENVLKYAQEHCTWYSLKTRYEHMVNMVNSIND